jgi:hypothetical protein
MLIVVLDPSRTIPNNAPGSETAEGHLDVLHNWLDHLETADLIWSWQFTS